MKSTTNFDEIKRGTKRHKESNDCTVVALCVVSNIEYDFCHAHLKKHGRPHRGGPSWVNFYRAIEALGLKKEMVTEQFSARTITTLSRELPKKGRFIVETRGHVLACRDGAVVDWTAGRRHRIRRIWKIEW